MTTTKPNTAAGLSAVQRARLGLLVAVLANLVIVEIIFIAGGPGENSVLTVADFVGLHAAFLLMVQVVLVSRLAWLDRRIGMDRLTSWHRWVGFSLMCTVLLHASLVVTGFAILDETSPLRTFLSLAGVPASLLGMCAATLMAVVAATSIRYARRRLSYETWHTVHVLTYLVVALGLTHQYLEGAAFTSSTPALVYWSSMWALVIGAFVVGRVVLPLRRNAYHQFQVSAVVPESDDVVSVYVTGRHLDELPVRPGQFFIWRFLGHNRWWQANPFSLSAAPDGRSLRLTARAVGTTSAGLRNLPVGTRVFAEGPYGAFTDVQRTRSASLLIAGGIGVTPIRSLLEASTGSVVVLYRVRSAADAALLPELQALTSAKKGQLHVLAGRTGSSAVPSSPFDPQALTELVPDIHDRDVYVCGPPAMTAAVLRALRTLKVPGRQVHAERFSLA